MDWTVNSLALSAAGERLAFFGSRTNEFSLQLFDRTNAILTQVELWTNSVPIDTKLQAVFSKDGRWLVFTSPSARTELRDVNNAVDIVVYEIETGRTEVISQAYGFAQTANAASDAPAISADGRFVLFRSAATDLVPGDSNKAPDIFLFDRLSKQLTLVSLDLAGATAPNSGHGRPQLDADGSTIAFTSRAHNLVPDDHNESQDVFVASTAQWAMTDTDADGLDDSWEVTHFGDLTRDGSDDFDGDGMSDQSEHTAGLDPTQLGSILRLEAGTFGTATELRWHAAPGRAYFIEYKDDLGDSSWFRLDVPIAILGPVARTLDLASGGARFYRVVVDWVRR
jgi:hypothetical protein